MDFCAMGSIAWIFCCARTDCWREVRQSIQTNKSAKYSVSEVDTDDLYNRMTEHIDKYLSEFSFENGEHIFFFPPYSALFWYDAQEDGYFDSYLQVKQYFVKKVESIVQRRGL